MDIEHQDLRGACPGHAIREHIGRMGMSQSELAERLGRSVPRLNELIRGKAPLSPDTALRLEYVLGVPASHWLDLEQRYQQQLLVMEQRRTLGSYQQWAKGFPVKALEQIQVLPTVAEGHDQVEALLKYFRVASPAAWAAIYEGMVPRLKHLIDPKALSAWLRLGELQAGKPEVTPFNQARLSDSIPRMQALMNHQPEGWLQGLQQECSHCGIALVFTPILYKLPLYGATRWINNRTLPLIQICERQFKYHAFWFAFFHQLAHLRYHNKSETFIDGLEQFQADENKKARADAFAHRMLLSQSERKEVFSHPRFDHELVMQLSRRLNRHPGILVWQIAQKYPEVLKDFYLKILMDHVSFEPFRIDRLIGELRGGEVERLRG